MLLTSSDSGDKFYPNQGGVILRGGIQTDGGIVMSINVFAT